MKEKALMFGLGFVIGLIAAVIIAKTTNLITPKVDDSKGSGSMSGGDDTGDDDTSDDTEE